LKVILGPCPSHSFSFLTVMRGVDFSLAWCAFSHKIKGHQHKQI
jgi:hypothetical protein